MTTKPRIKRFRIRPGGQAAAPVAGAANAAGAATGAAPPAQEDGFGDAPFPTAAASAGQQGADKGSTTATADEISAVRAEGLTGRQLRMARRIAEKNGIAASSDTDAVVQLRRRGIDPFKRATILDLVRSENKARSAGQGAAQGTGQGGRREDGSGAGNGQGGGALPARRGATPNLPQTYQEPPTPAAAAGVSLPETGGATEVQRIQRDIVRRRRRRLMLLAARLCVFVVLPTLLAAYYYAVMATPLYTTQSEFVIQQADSPNPAAGGLAGMFSGTALATSQDSVTVQSYLQSRDAMRRLDSDLGFRAHFSQPELDPLLRLAPDATLEAAYRLYQKMVRIGYDPSEGIIRMEVRATDPETSTAFSRALLSYAEEQVDRLTQRLRADQMSGARESYEEAEARMQAAQERVVELQERYSVLSSDVEVSLLTTQITNLETELTRERLNLQEMMANPSPNRARVEPLERRIANMEAQIDNLRARLTQTNGEGLSLARISSELISAEADVQTRQMMLAQALQQLEAARIEANRQVRYLSLGVAPVTPDEASHPRAFENTALAFLIFAGVYLMLAMTASILREQVSA
ncbi:capsule biosynthesis protein [Alkalilacustris brevis]|uniref:capsule biosynthesis protein n=1 Tax=Alkalilacustris brevis TaxID=2026338 RepID=UPI000E0D3A3D|nr:capsule biosynthesis protein [Alkalilacustris brevis]